MTSAGKQRCNEFTEDLRARFLATGDAMQVWKARSAYVDAAVLEAQAAALTPVLPDGLALVAVGGYGRRELFPYSDVDLLLLSRRPLVDSASRTAISDFVRRLWDGGLRCSQSVRTIEECCALHDGNLELTISLLDERCLAGEVGLYGQFRERFGRFLNSDRREILRRLCRATRSRHAKFHQTIYRLEPDVKEAPGGLRDLQATRWLQLLRAGAVEPPADPRPAALVATVRSFLHFRAARDQNLLDFESQDQLAAAAFSPWRDPAAWMRSWYRNASLIWLGVLSEMEAAETQERSMLANFRDWRARLSNNEFTVSRDLVFLRNPGDLANDAGLPLRLFQFVARHNVAPARQTEQRISAQVLKWTQDYATHPPGARWWREFLSLPNVSLALRSMRACGFLPAILPEWERLEHLVVRDFYHHYTVDEHTIVTLESLEELAGVKEGPKRRFAILLEESRAELWLLRLALLLHDLGKGAGGHHELLSLKLAQGIVRRGAMPEPDASTILFLVEHHLALSTLLQSRDLSDPSTARQAAALAGTEERLRLLTLMTLADIDAVNPTALTPWRLEQIWRLYVLTQRELNRELGEPLEPEAPPVSAEENPLLAEFLDGLPKRYLFTHTPEQASAQAQLYAQAREHGAALKIDKREGFFHLMLVARDRPFLFASVAGGLSSFNLNILKAEAFHNRHGYIADAFVFSDPGRNLELNPTEIERLRSLLGKIVLGEVRVEPLLRARPIKAAPARSGAVRPAVTLDAATSEAATLFEVIAQDRPGLLYSLASAISRAGCNIEVVLVNTEAHRAIDVFHVTRDGRKLSDEDAARVRAGLLAAAAGGPAKGD
jgi:[protein-PII] uridylyltransferase